MKNNNNETELKGFKKGQFNHDLEDTFRACGLDKSEEKAIRLFVYNITELEKPGLKSKVIEIIENDDRFTLRQKLIIAHLVGRKSSSPEMLLEGLFKQL